MIITKHNYSDVETAIYMYLFCQWVKCLIYKPIRLYGSFVRNWIIYCYVHDLNPYRLESIQKLLELYSEVYLPNGFDIWTSCTNEEMFIQLVKDLQQHGETMGYKNKTSKTYIQNNMHIKKIYFQSYFSEQHQFIINVYATHSFLNVDFDVNNLYIKCSPQFGIKSIEPICIPKPTQQEQYFGFFKVKQNFMHETIINILAKKANILAVSEHPLNKLQLIRRTDKLLTHGFKIQNHPALKESIENTLNITQCSICLDSLDSPKTNMVETRCLHMFHKNCIFKWWTEHFPQSWFLQCPNCRTLFNIARKESVNS